jgi:hypothetical protein
MRFGHKTDLQTGERTEATSLMFSLLQANITDKTHLVALPGIEHGSLLGDRA